MEEAERASAARHGRAADRLLLWTLCSLGVGAAIDGQFSGWSEGVGTAGWCGMMLASALVAVMYLGVAGSAGELAAADPATDGRGLLSLALGERGARMAGFCAALQYLLLGAAACFYLVRWLSALAAVPPVAEPFAWIALWALSCALSAGRGRLALSTAVTLALVATTWLLVFWAGALPRADFATYALNLSSAGARAAGEHGPWLPGGLHGALAALPSALWLFLAVEIAPLGGADLRGASRVAPRAAMLAVVVLMILSALEITINLSLPGGAALFRGTSQPVFDGLRVAYPDASVAVLGLAPAAAMAATFQPLVYASVRQFERLRVCEGRAQAAVVVGLAGAWLMLGARLVAGPEGAARLLGGVTLNAAAVAALLFYLAQHLALVRLRWTRADLPRPWRSPLGVGGAVASSAIALATLRCLLTNPDARFGAAAVLIVLAVGAVVSGAPGPRRARFSAPSEVLG